MSAYLTAPFAAGQGSRGGAAADWGLRRAIGEKTIDDRVLDETGDVLAAIVRRVILV